jgi:hypothetical protein
MNTKLETLKDNIGRQKQQNERKAAKIEEIKANIDQLNTLKSDLEHDNTQIKKSNEILHHEIEKFNKGFHEDLENLEDNLRQHQDELNNLKSDYRAAESKNSKLKDELINFEAVNQAKQAAIDGITNDLKNKQGLLNDLDRDVKAAQQNLSAAQEQSRQISDLNINLKEKLAMSKAQSQTLAENKIDHESELEQADTDFNCLKIKHNKLSKSIQDASIYKSNLEKDLKDAVEASNTAFKENDKLKMEQDKLYDIQLKKLTEFHDLIAQIEQLQISEHTDILDVYPPRLDKAQADINVTLKSLTHCADKYRTNLEYMTRKDWIKHEHYLQDLTRDTDSLIKSNGGLLESWNESSDQLHALRSSQIDRNRCRNVNEYIKNMNKLLGDRVKEVELENDENKPRIRTLQDDVMSAESKKLDPRQLDELNRKRELEAKEISELHKETTILNHKLNTLTSKRDSLSKNIHDYENDQKLLEKQRLDEEKKLKRERELQEKKEKLNIS